MPNNLDTLPTLGTAQYSLLNGQLYAFNASTWTKAYSITPKPDQAGRTFPTAEYSITLVTRINGDPADAAVQSVIQILSQPAGAFTYTGHGVGNLRINLLVDSKDCNWGPVPKVMAFAVNGGQTTEIEWTLTFSLPTADGSATQNQIMEYGYEATMTIDSEGYSHRDIQGYFKIPMTRILPTQRNLPDNADKYREQVVPPIPIGFTRINQKFGVDYSKQRETFSFTDIQMNPTYPQAGVLTCRASQMWSSSGPKMVSWESTIEAEYTVCPGTDARIAFMAFLNLLIQRGNAIGKAKRNEGLIIAATGEVSGGDAGTTVCRIPLRQSLVETNIYGPGLPKVKCSVTFKTVPLGLSAIIAKSGMWTPVTVPAPGEAAGKGNAPQTWEGWVNSTGPALKPRGIANVTWTANDDAIQDLNTPGLKPTVMTSGPT